MTTTYPIIKMFLSTGVVEFSSAEIISANIIQEINNLSAELPISTLEFRILSTDVTFSMFGSFNLLTEHIPLLVYESVGASSIFLGKFYLDDWENISESEFTFKAVDILGIMAKTNFDGIFFSAPTTLESVLYQVLVPANIPYTLDDSIKDVEIEGWTPPSDYREALQQICFASGATVSTARSETLLITPLSLPVWIYDTKIRDADKGMEQPVKLLPLVTNIELISHDYTQSLVIETAFEKYLEAGSHKIVFDKPYYDIVVDGPGYTPFVLGTEGGDYLATENGDYFEVGGEYVFGPNALYLEMSIAGMVTITAYPWVDNKKGYLFVETGAEEFLTQNTLKIEDATLVSADIAQTVLDKVRDYYRQRYTQNLSLFSSTVKPGDIIQTISLYDNKLLTSIQKMNIDLTGGYRMKVDSLGIVPVYVEPLVSPYRRPRTGIAISGIDPMRQNKFRRYA